MNLDQPRPDERDEQATTLTRRSLLHRSMLGVAGIGLAGILVACGDDDDQDTAPADNESQPPGEETGPEPGTSG